MTLHDLCKLVLARQPLVKLPNGRVPNGRRKALDRELAQVARAVADRVKAERPVDEIADLALQLAAVTLGSLNVLGDRFDAAQLAQLVLDYPSATAWWPELHAGDVAGEKQAVTDWGARVEHLVGQVLDAEHPLPIAGDSVRDGSLKTVVRLCLEFSGWSSTGSGYLVALGDPGGSRL